MVLAGPDARKPLPVLQEEWSHCTNCNLSQHRLAVGGQVVFGEGTPRGILFLGEGPGATEERVGRPFVGKSGDLLRKLIAFYQLGGHHYITNVILCRSCAPLTDPTTGLPMMSRGFPGRPPQPRYKDQPPTKEHTDACSQRLYEEIYLVDPVVIVALGQPAASFLRGSTVKILKERGVPEEITIPGAGGAAVLSQKKKEWVRKVKGELVMPTERSKVRYLMIPTLHPAFVLRNQYDEKPGNPFECLASDIRKAKQLYNKYCEEIFGAVPGAVEEEDAPYELLQEYGDEE